MPGLVARLIGRLEHPNVLERETAIIGLERAKNKHALPFLQDRLLREDDFGIKQQLESVISSIAQS